jgi:phenylalanyl-tRNA synthetase alpha chain
MLKIDLNLIEVEIKKEIDSVKTTEDLNLINKKYLDKNGIISNVFKSLTDLSQQEKKRTAKKANEIKEWLKLNIDKKNKDIIDQERLEFEKKEWIDISLPGTKIEKGHLHPLTQNLNKCSEIFEKMGFSIVDGPELEQEFFNFDLLNFPKDHPAREMQDTLFIKQKENENLSSKERLLMRTHTSPVQVRHMLKNKPPFRIFVPGRVFRNEATDASHEINFYQVEGLIIDKDISVANFKATIEQFFESFYEKKINIRLRPSFFPFTEPSFEVDMNCLICDGKGCSVCSQTGWLEMFGAGMVHPNVLKNSKIDPNKWQGFAFGFGWDRIVMMKHKIDDVRLFYGGDLRFLNQF